MPEYRLRVLSGLRQHFRARRAEGMLGRISSLVLDQVSSVKSPFIAICDYDYPSFLSHVLQCCKEELHSHLATPLSMWESVEKAGEISPW